MSDIAGLEGGYGSELVASPPPDAVTQITNVQARKASAVSRVGLAQHNRRSQLWLVARIANDGLVSAAAVAVAYWVRFHLIPAPAPGGDVPSFAFYAFASLPTGAVVVATFAVIGIYRNRRGLPFVDELMLVLGALFVSSLILLAVVALYRPNGFTYSRLTFACWLAIAVLFIPTGRYALRRIQRWFQGRGGSEPALIIGTGSSVATLVQRLQMFADSGLRPVAILDDALEPGSHAFGLPVVGNTTQMNSAIELLGVRVVFIALSEVTRDKALQLVESCRDLPVDFHLVPSMLGSSRLRLSAEAVAGVPVLTMRPTLALGGWRSWLKRALDITVSLMALVVSSPLMSVIYVFIKFTSHGPALIHQERVGRDGVTFRMHKFRSMRVDAEDESGPVWATNNDPRRTQLGRFLRRFSLDELPQFWNVLTGEMSLVGPRPERSAFAQQFAANYPGYADRLRVRPGLTGWAQANDIRGQTSVTQRLGYDLFYVENWSLGFDIKIILTTLASALRHQNAI